MGRKKKELKLKEPIRLREAKRKDGTVSLYLDMYHKGMRKKEGLKLYLVPEVNTAAKLQNQKTRMLAEQIKAQRILDLKDTEIINWHQISRKRVTLVAYLDDYVKDNEQLSPSSARVKRNVKARVEQYLIHIGQPAMELQAVDKDWCKGFIAFLRGCTYRDGKKTLGDTTCRMMVNRLGSMFNRAMAEGLITVNPFKQLEAKDKPRKAESKKEFLTIEELKRLMVTPCRYEIVKKAFLFSCFTGLRYSDIKSLRWDEILYAADGVNRYIEHRQVKTKNSVTIPLPDEALRWMPEPKEGEDYVFHALKITHTTVDVVLGEWVKAAGITKHITYHCSRHTCATTLITLGANLYVVSKILGHRSVRMTEVYAKIVDEAKVQTVNLVNEMFNSKSVAV